MNEHEVRERIAAMVERHVARIERRFKERWGPLPLLHVRCPLCSGPIPENHLVCDRCARAFRRALEVYEEGSQVYRNAMRELAGREEDGDDTGETRHAGP